MRGISASIVTAIAVLLPVFLIAPTSIAADMVPWVNDLQTAQQMATARGQLILVHFYSNDCPPCRQLESDVFSRPGFGHGVAQNYVPVRINVSVSPDLARQFGVNRWPTDLLLTPTGHEIHRMTSPQDINEYLRILNQVSWRVKSLPSGAPIEAASQGFRDDQPQSASYSSGSPYQFASQPVPHNSADQFARDTAAANGQAVPQYSLNSGTQGISVGRATMDPVMPGAVTGDAQGPNANVAAQQLALAQQQIELAQLQNSAPRVIENQFANSAATTTASGTRQILGTNPVIANSQAPALNLPQNILAAPNSASPQLALSPPSASMNYSDSGSALSAPSSTLSAPSRSLMAPSGSSINPSAPITPTAAVPAIPSMAIPTMAAPPQLPQPPTTQTKALQETGLEGYCPVTLIDEDRWVKGDKRWGARHRGRLYLFQSAAAQQKFLATPDQFSPALAGFDPVVFAERGQYTEGMRTHGIRYQDQIYMFNSEESLARFAESPTKYAEIVRQAIGANRQMR